MLHFLFHTTTRRCKEGLYVLTLFRYFVKFAFDCTFHIVVIIIMINILFGIIIDTFAQLRDEKQTKDDDKRNVCYICNIDRNTVISLSYLIIASSSINIQMDSRSTSLGITTCGPMSSI